MTASQLHPPVSVEESPIIRCLGLNYRDHAREAKMPIPSHPVLFIKPRAALCCGPYPQEKNPCAEKCARMERSDYEAELTVVIGGEDGGETFRRRRRWTMCCRYTCGKDGQCEDGAVSQQPVVFSRKR